MVEVCAVSRNPYQQVWIFLRMVVSIQQHFPVDDVGLKLHASFFEIRAENTGKICYAVSPLKKSRVHGKGDGGSVGRILYKINTRHGIQ